MSSKSSVVSSSKSIIKRRTCSKAALSDDLGIYPKFKTEQNLCSMVFDRTKILTFVLNKIEICSEQNVKLFGIF